MLFILSDIFLGQRAFLSLSGPFLSIIPLHPLPHLPLAIHISRIQENSLLSLYQKLDGPLRSPTFGFGACTPSILNTITQFICVPRVSALTVTLRLVLFIRNVIDHQHKRYRGFVSLASVVSRIGGIDLVGLVWTRLGYRGQVAWRCFEFRRV